MSAITAAMVNELRAKTGQAMMTCKQVLVEAEGDIQKAIDIFRKRGVKASLAERTATEGRVVGAVSPDGKAGALVEINCNTDFTAKSEPFLALGAKAAQALLASGSAEDAAVKASATEVAQQTGENIVIGKTARFENPSGKVGLYLYGITGKIGVLMSFSGNVAKADDELIKQLGGHIAFARPAGLTRDAVPAELVAKERELAVEAAKATGKPQQIAEKIAEGKLNSFFAERVLLDQEFFNAQVFKGNVSNFLKERGLTLDKYVRIEVGQA
jgi:elongation factor Ts